MPVLQGGRLIAGWPDNPFKGELRIVLKGNHFTPEWPLPNGLNQGAKVIGMDTLEMSASVILDEKFKYICWLLTVEFGYYFTGVFGILDLYGKPHNTSRTKLASTAPAGSSTITLQDPVDWQVSMFTPVRFLVSKQWNITREWLPSVPNQQLHAYSNALHMPSAHG